MEHHKKYNTEKNCYSHLPLLLYLPAPIHIHKLCMLTELPKLSLMQFIAGNLSYVFYFPLFSVFLIHISIHTPSHQWLCFPFYCVLPFSWAERSANGMAPNYFGGWEQVVVDLPVSLF